MPPIPRILDANANRAREALRVMEEAARFLVQDPELSQALKTLRHDSTHALAPLDSLILHRDTPGVVGTTLTTDHEHARRDTRDVVLAAGARLAEALRAIEEYAKVDASDDPTLQALARTCEQLRYDSYDLFADFPEPLATIQQYHATDDNPARPLQCALFRRWHRRPDTAPPCPRRRCWCRGRCWSCGSAR